MSKQLELTGIPRRRVALVDHRQEEMALKAIETTGNGPIQIVPALILDGRMPEGLLSGWILGAEERPQVSGFYEVRPVNHDDAGFALIQKSWWDAPTQAFYAFSGGTFDIPSLAWRGVVESVGRRRRRLL